jgi:hypothetical protein
MGALRQLSGLFLLTASAFTVAIALQDHPMLRHGVEDTAGFTKVHGIEAAVALNQYVIQPGWKFTRAESVALGQKIASEFSSLRSRSRKSLPARCDSPSDSATRNARGQSRAAGAGYAKAGAASRDVAAACTRDRAGSARERSRLRRSRAAAIAAGTCAAGCNGAPAKTDNGACTAGDDARRSGSQRRRRKPHRPCRICLRRARPNWCASSSA